jgi:uncharacterized membrane protein YecN with MAPEG domain
MSDEPVHGAARTMQAPAAADSRASARIAKPRAYSDFPERCKSSRSLRSSLNHLNEREREAMPLPVTLTFAAACAVLDLWLALRVARGRFRTKAMIGDGGDAQLLAAQRAHGNFTEYAPFAMILVAAIELAGGSPTWLRAAAIAFVAARIAHALGMGAPAPNPGRAGGIVATWLVLVALAGWAVALAV